MIRKSPAFYEIYHIPTGMTYGGSSEDVRIRLRMHKGRLENAAHQNRKLQEVYTTWEDFEFRIYYTDTVEEARRLEAEYLQKNVGWKYNCNERLSAAWSPDFNKLDNLVPEVHRDWVVMKRGSGEGRAKGFTHSEETRLKIGNGVRGKRRTQECRERMSASYHDSELVKLSREAIKDRDHVTIEIDGISYNSIAAASRSLGIGHGTITRRLASKYFSNYKRL